ncbi:hypothetical protein ACMD2_20556 [Ananas comosus]|uniref:Autophagy-related protein 101 n=1 Tax=Ananas comosus TaxID=4615 RepID=A0A199UM99_ANACO|nr:hypothetical protein ACMD2_20556 [Ananas comosus]
MQVCLSFYELKYKQPTWFSSKTERHYWEQWIISFHVTNPKIHGKSKATTIPGENALEETSMRRANLESSLREVLFQIIMFANEKKDHIPLITNSEVVSFPYEITIPR